MYMSHNNTFNLVHVQNIVSWHTRQPDWVKVPLPLVLVRKSLGPLCLYAENNPRETSLHATVTHVNTSGFAHVQIPGQCRTKIVQLQKIRTIRTILIPAQISAFTISQNRLENLYILQLIGRQSLEPGTDFVHSMLATHVHHN